MKSLNFFIKKYLSYRPMFFSIIRPLEAKLFDENKKYLKKKILDFGCGDGFFTDVVFGKKTIDVGLDLKNNLRINEAIKNKIYKKVVVYDGKKIPFENNYFQTVVSNCVLEHIENLDYSLKEIYRVLKLNGYFITSVMTDNWEQFLIGKKIFEKKYLKWLRKTQEHHQLLSPEKWTKKIKNTGFKIIISLPYLTPIQSKFLELFHYFSFPSLLSYKLFKKWVLSPSWWRFLFFDKIVEKILKDKTLLTGSGLFIVAKKYF